MFPRARCVSIVSSCCAFVARSGGFTTVCVLALASSDALLIVRGIWGLASFCACWRLRLRAGELPERPRALLERGIGISSNCDDADILYLTLGWLVPPCARQLATYVIVSRRALSPSLLNVVLVRMAALVQGLQIT